MDKESIPDIILVIEKLQHIRLFNTEAFEFYIDYQEQKPYHCCPLDASFRMYYDSNTKNREAMYDIQPSPAITIIRKSSPSVVFRNKFEEENLKSWSVYFEVQIDSLSKGEYEFYIEGKAGKYSEFKWKSINAKFEIG